jgi:hypothetical protein
MSRSKAVALINKLAALQPNENPAIIGILADCPELARNDWINRYGPASEWSEITDLYTTPVLAWLVKVLVTAERELGWIGGSVAAPIWLFRAYQQRSDAMADPLADWIFRNKGNDYLPFGSMSAARSLAEWRFEEIQRAGRRAAHAARQQAAVDAKAAVVLAKQDQAIHRARLAHIRKQEVEQLIKRIQALTPEARLQLIANDETIPLGALPKAVISNLIEAVEQSTSENRNSLLRRIDRRQSGLWKVLRNRLIGRPEVDDLSTV